jgi:predicted amino acid-binding ACT domain protein
MEEQTAIIIANTQKTDEAAHLAKQMGLTSIEGKIEDGSYHYFLIMGIINNVCRQFGIQVTKSDFYEQNNRIAAIVRADISCMNENFGALSKSLEYAGDKFKIRIKAQREDLFRFMHRI